ncbi:tetratricopeptide repeat protein [Kroppenstedtia pulmonis]|uniref:Tetratricopeptide repeat protein n=1 Tax=Kroppenstedtia pulmonis TaxID=1380685 RepID=A0A7D3XH85_9BACL|nr:tetratricopeptide repeat protein [Kroppenstedtia pulmonis]QKG83404.1 tetratricopeptide repeat protein [Kroppenstedtia pulmonis]
MCNYEKINYIKLDLPGFQLVRYILEKHSRSKVVHPVFITNLLRGGEYDNFYKTSYISDLGLRRTEEPKKLFLDNASILIKDDPDFKYPTYYDQTILDLSQLLNLQLEAPAFNFGTFISDHIHTPSLLNNILKYYADVLGNWSDSDIMAKNILNLVEDIPRTNEGASLLSNCGNLLAHTGNPLCRYAYKLASEYWSDPYQKFSVQFRLAVAEIKRIKKPNNIPLTLDITYNAAKDFGKVTNNATAKFSFGLIKNLEALYFIKTKQMDRAYESISDALNIVEEIPSNKISIDPDITFRYRIQIVENYALFIGITSDWESSLPIFDRLLELSRIYHQDSLPEVLAMYGYALVQAGKSEKAINILLESEQLFGNSPWVMKVPEIRKMLVVAYDNIGRDKEALYWLNKIDEYEVTFNSVSH